MSARKVYSKSLFEAIAENLAYSHYAVMEDVFTAEELQMLRHELYEWFDQGDFKSAGIGHKAQYQHNAAIRGDYIRWIDRKNTAPAAYFFFDFIDALSDYLNANCYIGIRSQELHFAMYPAGTYYKRHLDAFQHTAERKISVVCYLNEDWQPEEGGQLRIFVPSEEGTEKTIDLLPFGGRLVCFRSDLLEHEVLPATRERLTITGWLKNTNEVFA